MDKRTYSALTLITVGAVTELVSAGVIPPGLGFSVTSSSGSSPSTHVWNMTGSATDGNTANWFTDSDFSSITLPSDRSETDYEYWNEYSVPSDGYKIEVLQDVKADPFVESFFALKNTLAVPQTFVITTTLPVDGMFGTNYHGGSSAISLIDTNGGGASVSNNGTSALVTGLIDGSDAFTLFNAPFTLLAGPGSAASTNATVALDTNSYPDGSLLASSVSGSIGIRNEFVLSPGDIAAFTSFYRVESVGALPEPTIVGLGAIGAMLMLRRRNRN